MKRRPKFPLPLYCVTLPGKSNPSRMRIRRSGQPTQLRLPIFTREVDADLHASVRREGEVVLVLNTVDDVRQIVSRPQPNQDADCRVIVDSNTEGITENTTLTVDEFLAAEFVPSPAIDNSAE